MRTAVIILTALLLLGLAGCDDSIELAVPASIEIVDGDGQEALYATTLPIPLQARVTDDRGRPVAGVPVTWTATLTPISPATSTTDASGLASARWTLGTIPGTTRIGAHTAKAIVMQVGSASFTAHLRLGLDIPGVSFSPDTVNVSPGDVPVSIAVRVTNDYGSVTTVGVRFTSPSGAQEVGLVPLDRTEGTPQDGLWEGTVVIPRGAETGVWTLSAVRVYGQDHEGRRMWIQANASSLAFRALPYELTVTAD